MAVSLDLLNLPGLKTLSIMPVGTPPTHNLVSARVADTVRPQTCAHTDCCRRLESAGPRQLTLGDTPHGGLATSIELSYRRWRCADPARRKGSIISDPLSALAAPGHRLTPRLVRHVENMAIDLPFSTVARLTRVDERQVREIFYKMARSADELFPIEAPQILGLDEVHLNKRRGCAVFTDIGRSRIIEITQSRSAETVIATLLGMTNWQAIRVATTDMCDAYADAIRKVRPDLPIVLDKRHVIDLIRQEMDQIRRDLRLSLPKRQRRLLSGDAKLFNKRRFKLSEQEKSTLSVWRERFPTLSEAYALKERIFDIFNRRISRTAAEEAFDTWRRSMSEELARAFKPAVDAIQKRRAEVFAYFDFEGHVTNAYTETANGMIKRIYREARGFGCRFVARGEDPESDAAFWRFRAKVLMKHGGRDLAELARLRAEDKPEQAPGCGADKSNLAILATGPARQRRRRQVPDSRQFDLFLPAAA
jgi:transposase